MVWNQLLYKRKWLRKAERMRGRNKVTVSHPSVPALLTLPVVDLPRFETLTAAVQSTTDSLWENTWMHTMCKSYVLDIVAFIKRNSLIRKIHSADQGCISYLRKEEPQAQHSGHHECNKQNLHIDNRENLKGLLIKASGWKPCCYEGHRKTQSCIFTKVLHWSEQPLWRMYKDQFRASERIIWSSSDPWMESVTLRSWRYSTGWKY